MTTTPRIGLLGFGEVGQILAQDLVAAKLPSLAFDLKFTNPESCPSKALKKIEHVQRCASASEMGQSCEIVISAVTAENAEMAALSVSHDFHPNSWFLDLNSAAPNTKRAIANRVNQAGGRYVEAAVMSPVPPHRLASPIILGGSYAEAFLPIAKAIGFSNVSAYSTNYGDVSAAKMCRSVMIKGMEALLTESLVTARAHGVEHTVLSSLDDLFPGPDWPTLAKYMIERTLEHGGRRAEEMREVAKTVAAAGLTPDMSEATVRRQEWAKAYPEFGSLTSLDTLLDALVRTAKLEKKEMQNEASA